ncbi:MAG: thymidine kinase [Phycisphaerae bacterium]
MRGPSDGHQQERSTSHTQPARRGTITVICGCMFSGKTTELLRRLADVAPDSVLVVKHKIDRRYRVDAAVSHTGQSWPAVAVASAHEVSAHIRSGIEVTGIDEAHFFDAALVDVVQAAAARGIDVIVTSLDRDSWGRPFPVTERLCSIADEPIVKRAVCARCGCVGDRTQRLTPIIDGNMVGGPESYEPRCLKCWHPPPEPPPAH